MSYTQGTTHYNLPQTLGDDKRDWFDTNQPFADVDAALYSAYEGVQTLDKDLTAVKSDLNTAQTDIANIKQYDAENTVKVSALETLTAQHTVDIEDVRNDAEDMICSVEEKSATAQYEHLTGAYFRYNDTLYVTTTDIRKGDTIVPNVNCRTTDVASEFDRDIHDFSPSLKSNDHFSLARVVYAKRYGRFVQFQFGITSTTEITAGQDYVIHFEGLPSTIGAIGAFTSYYHGSGQAFGASVFYGDDMSITLDSGAEKGVTVYFTYLYISNSFI